MSFTQIQKPTSTTKLFVHIFKFFCDFLSLTQIYLPSWHAYNLK